MNVFRTGEGPDSSSIESDIIARVGACLTISAFDPATSTP